MNGQSIIHVDLAPNYIDGGIDAVTPTHWINFNSDSLNDFRFNGLSAPAVVIDASGGSNAFLGNDGTFKYALALNDMDPINSSQNTWFNASVNSGVLNFISCFAFSQWCGVNDKYLGIRFRIGTGFHYGWVKLDVNASGSSFTIKEYAYVDTPNIGLTAGQSTLGIEDASVSKVKIVASNKSIKLYNLPEHTQYQVFNITGQSVLNGKTSNQTHMIEAYEVSSGIYFIELKDTETSAVLRKKIVI